METLKAANTKERKLHLIIPIAMVETVLCPTGFRNSSEAEASWRLTAAAVAVRVLKPKGILPVDRVARDAKKTKSREIHVPLAPEDYELFEQVAKEEGGSMGEMVRQLLLMTQRVIEAQPNPLNHDGLVAAILEHFPSSVLGPILAEW